MPLHTPLKGIIQGGGLASEEARALQTRSEEGGLACLRNKGNAGVVQFSQETIMTLRANPTPKFGASPTHDQVLNLKLSLGGTSKMTLSTHGRFQIAVP